MPIKQGTNLRKTSWAHESALYNTDRSQIYKHKEKEKKEEKKPTRQWLYNTYSQSNSSNLQPTPTGLKPNVKLDTCLKPTEKTLLLFRLLTAVFFPWCHWDPISILESPFAELRWWYQFLHASVSVLFCKWVPFFFRELYPLRCIMKAGIVGFLPGWFSYGFQPCRTIKL